MGENQAYKAMQRSRLGSASGGPDEVEDGMVDGSFHSPEWHAARLASLNTSHTVTWEEYKKKQKEDEMKKGELEADKDRMMREYRAQLDAERAKKLAQGRNHAVDPPTRRKRGKVIPSFARARRESIQRGNLIQALQVHLQTIPAAMKRIVRKNPGDQNLDPEDQRKKKKHRSRSKRSRDQDSDNADGPVPLSKFFGNVKS